MTALRMGKVAQRSAPYHARYFLGLAVIADVVSVSVIGTVRRSGG